MATKERRMLTNRRTDLADLRDQIAHRKGSGSITNADARDAESLLSRAESALNTSATFDGGSAFAAAPAYYDACAFINAARAILEPERPLRGMEAS